MKTLLATSIVFLMLTITCKAQWVTSGTTVYNLGNVGIGVTSPTFPLVVGGATQMRGIVAVTQSSPLNSLIIDGTSSTSHKIYNNAPIDFSLGTNSSTNQLYLQSGGNVGIGTTTPNDLLNVNGNVSVGTSYGNAVPTSPGAAKLLYVYPTATGLSSAAGATTYYLDDLNVQAQSQSGTWYPTTGVLSSVLKGGNLNLSAGTINETGNNGSRLATYTGGDLNFYPGYAKNGSTAAANPQLNYGNVVFFTPTGASRIDASYTEFMRIDGGGYNTTASAKMPPHLSITGGNVGIGTTDTKGYLLAVNGTAIATSMTVKLYANWPDFVFKPAYHLPSLTNVRSFIDQNHHLPDVPSSADVEKNGINLGEMNKVLLQKVEELTLYLIGQDKQVRAAQELIQRQQAELRAEKDSHEVLEDRMKKLERQLDALAGKQKAIQTTNIPNRR